MTTGNPTPVGRLPRILATDVADAVLLVDADPHIPQHVADVLRAIAGLPAIHNLDECIRAGDFTLDEVCRRLPQQPRPWVFYAVALLEDHGYLPHGGIR